MVPEIFNCATCEHKSAKHTKLATKLKAKKLINNKLQLVRIEHPKPVAPLDLLLSVAENRSKETTTKHESFPIKKLSPKVLGTNGGSESSNQRAIIQNGFVYLSNGGKIDDCSIKMKKQKRDVFSSLCADLNPNTSRY